jgi:ABC-type transporter Mla subunit MlaD
MTEIREPSYEAPDAVSEDGGSFVAITAMLQEEGRRLVAVAEDCRSIATQLAERDAALAGRERGVAEAERDLERRQDDLNRWQNELNDRAGRLEDARGRIAEAAEREAALKAMAESLLERYQQPPGAAADGAHSG